MPTIVGTLLIPNADYLESVSAVDVQSNGQTIYVTYIDSDGNLKAGSTSFVQNVDGSVPSAMSGCSIL